MPRRTVYRMTSSPVSYQAGSLSYTRHGLLTLSCWLLWGDFAFYFFEAIFLRFIPIYLKELQASNTLIGIMTGSFAGLVNVLFLPGISKMSDNFRSRLGRRIPFLLVVTPIVVGTLILVGFAPEIGGWIHDRFAVHIPWGISRGAFILGLLSVLIITFHFFNMVLVNGYNWLIRDVVPLKVMARFLAWFRIVGTVSSVIFLWYVFPHLLTHRGIICLTIGVFYLVVFLLMCFKVKEGTYPAPEAASHKGIFRLYADYFRECLQVPLYRNFLLTFLLVIVATNCATSFTTLFMKESLGISMDGMGRIFSYTAALSAIVYFPLGWLCDRISPVKVAVGALIGLSLCPLAGYFWVQTKGDYIAYSLMFILPTSAWLLASMAVAMLLFPSAKFGQFSGAMNVFGCGGQIGGNLLIGFLIDFFHNDYRMALLWIAVFAGAAIIPMTLVIRGWIAHGGPSNYVPPQPVIR